MDFRGPLIQSLPVERIERAHRPETLLGILCHVRLHVTKGEKRTGKIDLNIKLSTAS